MHHKKLFTVLISLFAANNTLAEPYDSTILSPPVVKPVTDTYMLAHGRIKTTTGAYIVNINATNKRCTGQSEPQLATSIASIDVYGASQAIEGVTNTLTLNPFTYQITGYLGAPVNVAARDNGAMVNWQIWCKPTETA